jgi:cold shock CspA family protein
MSVESAQNENTLRHVGLVKWFDSRAGFGFITLMSSSDDFKNPDIFTHHSSISPGCDIYKYLVQGEYVEFDIQNIEDTSKHTAKHTHQATRITGICGGPLMYETRHNAQNSSRVRKAGFVHPTHHRPPSHDGHDGH